jgi:tRNA/tmRNA/rRNA uracil-C5-methylase (TrmA/RlmC/RlmD family)
MVGGSEGVILIVSDFEIIVEKLVYGGDGLGRLDGRAVLAPFVLPGERVRLEGAAEKPGLIRASLAEVLSPAPERIAPVCPYFTRCGGCHYQHAPYELQLALKRAILDDQLRRIGKIAPPEEIEVVAGEPWQYRNRVQLHIAGTQLGYREAQTHRLCAIESCPISSPAINRAIATLHEMLRDSRWPRFIRSTEPGARNAIGNVAVTHIAGTQLGYRRSADAPDARHRIMPHQLIRDQSLHRSCTRLRYCHGSTPATSTFS